MLLFIFIDKIEETKHERLHDNTKTDETSNKIKCNFSTSYLEKINESTLNRYEQKESSTKMHGNHNHRFAKVQMKMKKALENTKIADANNQVPRSFFNHKMLSHFDQFALTRNRNSMKTFIKIRIAFKSYF